MDWSKRLQLVLASVTAVLVPASEAFACRVPVPRTIFRYFSTLPAPPPSGEVVLSVKVARYVPGSGLYKSTTDCDDCDWVGAVEPVSREQFPKPEVVVGHALKTNCTLFGPKLGAQVLVVGRVTRKADGSVGFSPSAYSTRTKSWWPGEGVW